VRRGWAASRRQRRDDGAAAACGFLRWRGAARVGAAAPPAVQTLTDPHSRACAYAGGVRARTTHARKREEGGCRWHTARPLVAARTPLHARQH
jgi:hypothetical protein